MISRFKALTTSPGTDTTSAPNASNSIARRMALHASSTSALNTMEILEAIISFMPRAEILTRAQRVSLLWKEIIETSPTIQTLLWRGSQVLSPHGNTHDPTAIREQRSVFACLSSFLAPTKQAFGVPIYSGSIELNEQFFSTVPRNDMFEGIHNHVTRFAPRRLTIPPETFKEGVMEWAHNQMLSVRAGRTRPTYLDMFITTPPITAAQVSIYMWSSDLSVFPLWVCATVYDRNGITYVLAAETVQKIKASIPPDRFMSNAYMPPMISFVADEKDPEQVSSSI